MIINVEFGKTYESLYNLRINQHFLEELRKTRKILRSGWFVAWPKFTMGSQNGLMMA